MRVNTRDAFKHNSNTLDRANRLNTILAKIADPSFRWGKSTQNNSLRARVVTGSGWYDAGSYVTVSASVPTPVSGEQYIWNGWTGIGTGSYTGADNPTTVSDIQMNGPIIEVTSWIYQYYLTVNSA